MAVYDSSVFIEGLCFGEGPRWHNGRLYFSDFYKRAVFSVDEDRNLRKEFEVINQPSGLGWLSDGSILVVSMLDRSLYRYSDGALEKYADLSDYCSFYANDMVVDQYDRAYVGNFGFDLHGVLEEKGPAAILNEPRPSYADVVLVNSKKEVKVVAQDIDFPNGMVITPDGKRLIMAETLSMRLLEFDILEDGSLANKRVFADLSSNFCMPDGICLDSEGAVWVANAISNQCLRVVSGRGVTDTVNTEITAFACMLGGSDRRTLFIMSAPSSMPNEVSKNALAKILVARVEVPGAGYP